MKQHNSFKNDIDMLAEAYGSMQSKDSSVLNESADAPNPVEDNGEAAYKGGIVDHDWASHITAPPFGESIKKILHHNLTEQGIVEEYYVEHNGKLVGVLAEDVTVVFEEGHPPAKSSDEEDDDDEKKEHEGEEDEESTAHGARPKLIGVPIYR